MDKIAMDARGDLSSGRTSPAGRLTSKHNASTPIARSRQRRKNIVTETGDAVKRRSKIDIATSVEQLKYRRFLCEPMGDKVVSALPGVTAVAESRLRERGYATAAKVWGKFLTLQKNPELFHAWMHDVSGANKRAVRSCCRCLEEYCDMYM